MSHSWTIYHNPNCSKSRKALAILQELGIKPCIIEYLKEAPSKAELESILQKLGVPASKLVRTNDEKFSRIKLDLMDQNAVVAALVKEPSLLQRPIVVHQDRAVIGRPPETVHELLK